VLDWLFITCGLSSSGMAAGVSHGKNDVEERPFRAASKVDLRDGLQALCGTA
jgi:hypothetical protein